MSLLSGPLSLHPRNCIPSVTRSAEETVCRGQSGEGTIKPPVVPSALRTRLDLRLKDLQLCIVQPHLHLHRPLGECLRNPAASRSVRAGC